MTVDRRTFLKSLPLLGVPIEPASTSAVPVARACGIVTQTIVARQKALSVQWATLWSPTLVISRLRFDADGRAQIVRELDLEDQAGILHEWTDAPYQHAALEPCSR